VVINEKVSDKVTLEKLSPEDIATIEIVKGEKAIQQYNAPNGAVIVKTKE
jgi:hypothetical protein